MDAPKVHVRVEVADVRCPHAAKRVDHDRFYVRGVALDDGGGSAPVLLRALRSEHEGDWHVPVEDRVVFEADLAADHNVAILLEAYREEHMRDWSDRGHWIERMTTTLRARLAGATATALVANPVGWSAVASAAGEAAMGAGVCSIIGEGRDVPLGVFQRVLSATGPETDGFVWRFAHDGFWRRSEREFEVLFKVTRHLGRMWVTQEAPRTVHTERHATVH